MVDTLSDLFINGGQRQFEPLLDALDVEIKSKPNSSDKLTEAMIYLSHYNIKKLDTKVLEFATIAKDEILRLDNLP